MYTKRVVTTKTEGGPSLRKQEQSRRVLLVLLMSIHFISYHKLQSCRFSAAFADAVHLAPALPKQQRQSCNPSSSYLSISLRWADLGLRDVCCDEVPFVRHTYFYALQKKAWRSPLTHFESLLLQFAVGCKIKPPSRCGLGRASCHGCKLAYSLIYRPSLLFSACLGI